MINLRDLAFGRSWGDGWSRWRQDLSAPFLFRFLLDRDRLRQRCFLLLGQIRRCQAGQVQHQLTDIGIGAFGGMVDHLAELVEGRQEQVGNLGVRDHLLRPQHIQDGLGFMRQFRDLVQTEEGTAALNGMGCPEYLVHQLRIDIGAALFNR